MIGSPMDSTGFAGPASALAGQYTVVTCDPRGIGNCSSAQLRAQIQDIYDTYRADGADKAMAKFMTHAGLGEASGQEANAPRWEP